MRPDVKVKRRKLSDEEVKEMIKRWESLLKITKRENSQTK